MADTAVMLRRIAEQAATPLESNPMPPKLQGVGHQFLLLSLSLDVSEHLHCPLVPYQVVVGVFFADPTALGNREFHMGGGVATYLAP